MINHILVAFGSGAANIGLWYEASKVRNASSLRTYAVLNKT